MFLRACVYMSVYENKLLKVINIVWENGFKLVFKKNKK